jgi:hypothetical protein
VAFTWSRGLQLSCLHVESKPRRPWVMEGKGEGAPGLLTPIVYTRDYTRITAQQELGNKTLPGQSSTGYRLFHTVAAGNLVLEEDATSRPSGYEPDGYQTASPRAVGEEGLWAGARITAPSGRICAAFA